MSVIGSNALAGASGQGGGGFVIEKSLRFNDVDSAYLDRTPSSAGNRKTWTLSFWVKNLGQGTRNRFHFVYGSGNENTYLDCNVNATGSFQLSSWGNYFIDTTAKFRDPSAWYHFVVQFDTTNSTAADRRKLWVNGVEVATNGTAPTLNGDYGFNNNVKASIGSDLNSSGNAFNFTDCYLAEYHFIDGQALDHTSFGAFDDNGVWQAVEYTGSHGTNGFHLDFADGSNLGNDAAGSNNWTANNLTGVIPVISSPNRPTWNGSVGSNWTTSNSNYDSAYSGSGYTPITATLSANTTYHFFLNHRDGSAAYGGWFFSSGSTPNSNTVPDELGGNSLGLRVDESSIGTYGTYATANGTSSGQNQISVPDLQYGVNDENQEFVINTTVGKVWARTAGASTWVGGGDPSNTSSTATFLIPTGQQYFGYMAYSGSTYANFKTQVGDAADLDLLRDSPTNGDATADTGVGGEVSGNYCTGNPLHPNMSASVVTLSEGNLKGEITSGSSWHTAPCTIGVSSGKWYFEQTIHNSYAMVGIAAVDAVFAANGHHTGTHATGIGYFNDGNRYTNNTATSYGASYGDGDVIGCAFDMDARSVTFYKNGVSQGVITSIITANKTYAPVFCLNGQDGAGSYSWNFGQRPFAYSAPSGYKALCTANLPTPDVPDGSAYFDVKLYDGNGSTNAITGLNFSPDLVWLKSRGQAKSNCLFDTVRGVNERLLSNTTDGGYTVANSLTSFDSNGFTLGSNNEANNSGYSHVAWAWDAGSSNTTVSAGSLTSSLYNQDQVWSNFLTSSNGFVGSYTADQAFNEVLDTGGGSATNGAGGVMTFAPTSALSVSTMDIRVYSDTTITFPDSSTVAVNGQGADLGWISVSLPSSFTGFTGSNNITLHNTNGGLQYFDGLRINGKILVNSNISLSVPSIASTYRANPTAGFSIVTWTGTGSAGTVAHGLQKKPELIISKVYSANYSDNWPVYHSAYGAGTYMYLNTNIAAPASYTGFFNGVEPTSSVFSVGTANSDNTKDLIAYCFTSVAGYSAFGTYEGNQNANNGAVIWTGFTPAFILVKYMDSAGQWYIYDHLRSPNNVAYQTLQASQPDIENTSSGNFKIDILSSGFKMRQSNGPNNNGTYIWAAFAKNPFQANGGIAR